MLAINYLAVVVAAVAAWVEGGLWYSPFLFGKAWAKVRSTMPGAGEAKMSPGSMLAEVIRSLVIAFVLARFVVWLDIRDVRGALHLGAWLWFGFWAVVLAGSVIHENYPKQLYAIHAGDGLVKILVMSLILALWR